MKDIVYDSSAHWNISQIGDPNDIMCYMLSRGWSICFETENASVQPAIVLPGCIGRKGPCSTSDEFMYERVRGMSMEHALFYALDMLLYDMFGAHSHVAVRMFHEGKARSTS